MKLSAKARNAFMIGILCSISYFAVYIARNILSAVTPQMLEDGYTEEYIGLLSSLYFGFYAVGQLINGAIGDKIKGKYMISAGLLSAGINTLLFPILSPSRVGATAVYALTGFSLSMIYGPMTKLVSENTDPIHATRCSLGYTFSSFFGSPAAGILATFLAWQSVFSVTSVALAAMATAVFICVTLFERRGIIEYGHYKPKEKGAKNIRILVDRGIIKFSLISILTGIIRTSVVFWLPTYLSQYLGFSSKTSASIFTVTTFVISFVAFIVIFVYEKLGRNIDRTVLLMFSCSALFFAITYFFKAPLFNIIFIVLAIMASNGAATMLWSVYCPSLKDTGMVSSATGYLDFLSYMAAALANILFANAVSSIGWSNLLLVWFAIVSVGVIVALPFKKKKPHNADFS